MATENRAGQVPKQATVEDALWSLYDLAGQVRVPPGLAPFQRLSLEYALSLLSEASSDQVTVTSRRAALADLARGNGGELPRFEELKDTYARYVQTLVPETPLDSDMAMRSETEQMVQEELDSWVRDVCTVEQVIVDEMHQAVWMFSEIETTESFDHLESWVRPENWPRWGPVLFKEMTPLGRLRVFGTGASDQVHGNYLEIASFAGEELRTVLRCDFKRTPQWVGMSYDLDNSLDKKLSVDRGFLLATELGNGNFIVKALKVVAFTDPLLNLLCSAACPLWTDFVRQSTRNAATALKLSSPGTIGVTSTDSTGEAASGSRQAGRLFEAGRDLASDISDRWVQSVSDAANDYSSYAADVAARLCSGTYGRAEASQDSSQLLLMLARDWARVYQATTELAAKVAGVDIPPRTVSGPGSGSGGSTQGTREFFTVLLPAPTSSLPLTLTDLDHVDVDGATLKSPDLTVTPTNVGPTPDPADIHIELDTTRVPAGPYEGSMLLGTGPAQQSAVAHVYVCKARLA